MKHVAVLHEKQWIRYAWLCLLVNVTLLW